MKKRSPVALATALALGLVLGGCQLVETKEAKAIEAAQRLAPRSSVPIEIESVLEGPLARFAPDLPGSDPTRHVWDVSMLGAFEGEGVAGNVPHYRHHRVILDYETLAFIVGFGSP